MAALWMSGWLSLTLVMVVAGREATRELNVFELMELRSVLSLVLLYPLIHFNGGLAIVKTTRLRLHVGRNLIHYCAQLGWFFALTLIPIGQVVAIEFTMPIWTAILATTFLGERMTIWKVAAIVLGLVGVLVIVRPAAGEMNQGQLIALRRRLRHFHCAGEIPDPHGEHAFDHLLDAGRAIGRGFRAHAGRLGLAVRRHLGLDRRDRHLRHLRAFLPGARDALCGCDYRDTDGFPQGAADRNNRLADLWGAARHADDRRVRQLRDVAISGVADHEGDSLVGQCGIAADEKRCD